jgi:hypothetical protein
VQYSASDGVYNNSVNHGEIVNLYYSGENAIVRYNIFRNAFKGGCGTALVAITQADGLQFYGNLAYNFDSCDAAIGFNGYGSSNNKVYNNTFIQGGNYNAGTAFGNGTNNLVYNNLWINCTITLFEGTHDYNGFSNSDSHREANAQTNIPTSIFANYTGNDFKLVSATKNGLQITLTEMTKDMLNNQRGQDGTWDLGAFEYLSNTTTTILPPNNVTFQ